MRLVVENMSASPGKMPVLHDVSFEAEGAQFIGLVGPNGVGKTTLIRAMAGLLPFAGTITLDGEVIGEIAPRLRARRISYLAQDAGSYWPLEVSRLVALGRLPWLETFRAPSSEDEAAIKAAMSLADVEVFRGRNVLTLSGGERARVLLARALAVEAPLLLVDEPVSALDPYHQIRIMEVLRAYASTSSAGPRMVVAVLHDLSLAARYCDRLILLDGGEVRADGAAFDVLTPDNLEKVYRVRALQGGEGDERYILPIARKD